MITRHVIITVCFGEAMGKELSAAEASRFALAGTGTMLAMSLAVSFILSSFLQNKDRKINIKFELWKGVDDLSSKLHRGVYKEG